MENEISFFLEHVHFFWTNRGSIINSQMYFALVPVTSGLSIRGAFPSFTIGMYLEWWRDYESSSCRKDPDGTLWRIWKVSGSDLSGANMCSLVNDLGEVKTECISDFLSLIENVAQQYSLEKIHYKPSNSRTGSDLLLANKLLGYGDRGHQSEFLMDAIMQTI